VHQPSFGSENIFCPELLKVNERTLPFAKRNVLQAGNRKILGLGVHIIKMIGTIF
jgi:hypothetical protein